MRSVTLAIDIVALLAILIVGGFGFAAIILSIVDDIKASHKRRKEGRRSEELRSPEGW